MATNAPSTTATRAPAATTSTSNAAAAGSFGAFGADPGFSANTPEPVPSANLPQTTVSPAAFMGNDISINKPTKDITISPSEISVLSGDYIAVKFIMPRIVRGKPLLIEVTTDIPQSVIMPEVHVRVGSNVGSVNLKGGRPGKGLLYVKADGYPNVQTIPITVK
jgi:hypothetical protein